MEKEIILKNPPQFATGDVINTCFGYTVTLLELIEIQRQRWSSSEWYVFKVTSNISDSGNVYIHRYNSHYPQIIIENIGEEEVKHLLETRPFKDYAKNK